MVSSLFVSLQIVYQTLDLLLNFVENLSFQKIKKEGKEKLYPPHKIKILN